MLDVNTIDICVIFRLNGTQYFQTSDADGYVLAKTYY
jgi:hypothetical protein